MKNFWFLTLLLAGFCLAKSQQQKEIPLLKYEELEQKIRTTKEDILVVNFWATTCAPCVKELPHFMEVNAEQSQNPNFKMLLVSLDRAKDIERVKNFLKEKNITAEVVILDDNKRMNTWIPRFDEMWGGEIPVTIFYKNGEKSSLYNGELSKEALAKTIHQLLN